MTTKTMDSREELRQSEQIRLDLLKDAKARNRWGQFATPASLAVDIARYATALAGARKHHLTFLDPAIGTGSFYSALRTVSNGTPIERATGVELDPIFSEAANSIWKETGLSVIAGDFTRQPPPSQDERFNLILTNPPYVRHHHIGAENKIQLREAVRRRLGTEISGLAGLYCYFLLLAHDWLEPDGFAAWLIPSEFMDVNYGAAVREYLTTKVRLLHVHRFDPEDVQFADALVTSVIVVFAKNSPSASDTVRFSVGGSLLAPTREHAITIDQLRASERWTSAAGREPGAASKTAGTLTFADLFAIKRGIATGSNDYFIMPLDEAKQRGIPEKALRPVLPSPRYLDTTVVEAAANGYPVLGRPLALIDTRMSEAEIQAQHPRFWEYILEGKNKGIHESYLTSRRSPWYSQEQRPAPPFLCTYMGRSRGKGKPFRFIWNRSLATAANVYLLLYPRDLLKTVLERDPSLYSRVFELLNDISSSDFLQESRVYGGGLHKLEPRELGRLPAEPFLKAIPGIRPHRQMELGLPVHEQKNGR